MNTMKKISRQIGGALLGLCVSAVVVRGAQADEIADWIADMRRQNDEFNRQAQADRDAMDKFNREAQADRDAREKWSQQVQEAQREINAWNQRNLEAQQSQGILPAAGAQSTSQQARAARPPQVRSFAPAVAQWPPVPQNPAVLQQIVQQRQAQARQQMMEVPRSPPQLIINPFVNASK